MKTTILRYDEALMRYEEQTLESLFFFDYELFVNNLETGELRHLNIHNKSKIARRFAKMLDKVLIAQNFEYRGHDPDALKSELLSLASLWEAEAEAKKISLGVMQPLPTNGIAKRRGL